MHQVFLTHTPEALEKYFGARALALRPKVIATPHVGGLTPTAFEPKALETVAQGGEIIH